MLFYVRDSSSSCSSSTNSTTASSSSCYTCNTPFWPTLQLVLYSPRPLIWKGSDDGQTRAALRMTLTDPHNHLQVANNAASNRSRFCNALMTHSKGQNQGNIETGRNWRRGFKDKVTFSLDLNYLWEDQYCNCAEPWYTETLEGRVCGVEKKKGLDRITVPCTKPWGSSVNQRPFFMSFSSE